MQALKKLLSRMAEYAPSKRDIAVSALTGLAVGTPIALTREKLMEGERSKFISKKARAAARDSAKRAFKKLQETGK